MFLVRVGTPISEIDPDELPSPRGEGDRKLSNRIRKIMPRRPYEDKNLREILDMLYRNRKFVIQSSNFLERSYLLCEEKLQWAKNIEY